MSASRVEELEEEVRRLRAKLGQPFYMGADGVPHPVMFPQDEARAAALEEAARVAEAGPTGSEIARRIRALKEKP